MAEPDAGRPYDHVVAGTGGSEAARAAVRYAAREAAARRVALELVHVAPPGLATDAIAAYLLEESRRVAAAEVERLPVRLTLLSGPDVETLVARAADAQLLVVGAPTPGWGERLPPGSAALGVAGRARCPVVVVPAEERHEGLLRRIVVGLTSPAQADDELLSAAFAEALRHHAELAVVHAWQRPPAGAAVHGRHDPDWLPGEAALVEEQLAPLRQAFPAVQLRVDVVRGAAADALVAASPEGSVLMLARSRARGPARALGPTARAVLQRARCPVELVPTARTHTDARPRTLTGLAHH
jgi:nucleotide-binding universal stress UspA family protein